MINEKTTQLEEKVSEYFNNETRSSLQLPYSRIQATIDAVLDNTSLKNNHIDYAWIELMKIVLFTTSILSHMEVEYELPLFDKEDDESEDMVNWYLAYDELYPIWNMVRNYGNIDTMEIILEREIELAEKKCVQLGMFEGRILESVERITTVLEDVNRTIQDDKKFGKILKTIGKNIPQLGELVKK